jgi:tRNA(Ile)-lysidine synthase
MTVAWFKMTLACCVKHSIKETINMKFKLTPHSSFFIKKKNLLAFSAGIDSSALFFLLIEHRIPFDMALVNYGTREQSDTEEAHAIALAKEHGLQCYTAKAPKFASNFEKNARDFRYAFFEELIMEHGYDNLLTAHQLNDRMEWFLMQMTRGAGAAELIGMEPIQKRPHYTLVHPLLTAPKSELLGYLQEHNHPYFVDESNADARHERNRFRAAFSDPLIAQYGEGIARSFDYLLADKTLLDAGYTILHREKELRILRLQYPQAKVRAADQTLKQLGYLLSAAQREEIGDNDSVVVGGKWAVELSGEKLYIAPYTQTPMPKEFKERCRTQHIPPKVRPYFFTEKLSQVAFANAPKIACKTIHSQFPAIIPS